ncbi:ATP-binding protein [Endozoicomonas euniceicola]|uniref:ATP-binding protein n=1 Tax=Endozoicomonas euniceicola TaxID=1234143 RepID=A0ABY6GQA3_9GAMM|nr:ATP-binding protein [Endozoicomonas euniceicola]UYM14928.1 ATP-binding protein [Endozoicomonas euniceicola]
MVIYQKWNNPDYRGNPLIEALPKCLDQAEIIKECIKAPLFKEEEKKHEDVEREIYSERLDSCTIPNHNYYRTYKKIYKLLLKSYVNKSPISPESKQLLYSVASDGKNAPSPEIVKQTTSKTFFLTGLSGMGKSWMIEIILDKLFQQVITHESYNDEKLNITQIVYLKFNCPSDASRRALCNNFFSAIDDLLGTNFYEENNNKNIPIETLEKNIKKLCLTYHIGLIVIDELQNLSIAKAGGAQIAMQFFESIVNELHVSLAFVGTYDCFYLYTDKFRTARRMSTEGIIDLEQPQEDDETWNQLLEKLWKFQWVQNPGELTSDIRHTAYELTQGITVCTVMLLKHANAYAIENGEETITAETLTTVYNEEFKLLMPALDALRSNNPEKVANYDDLMPIAQKIKNMKSEQGENISDSQKSENELKSKPNPLQKKKRKDETAKDNYNRLNSSGFFSGDASSI